MKHIPRYYLENVPLSVGQRMLLTGPLAHHVLRVLRKAQGDRLILFNGDARDYTALLRRIQKQQAEVEVMGFERVHTESEYERTLLQAIPKPETWAWIVEKAVEMGVTDIVPVRSAYSENRFLSGKAERWKKIAVQAMQQCGRFRLPRIAEPLDWEIACQQYANSPSKYAFTPEPFAEPLGVWQRKKAEALLGNQVVAIGPEGGWTAEEHEMARLHGFQWCQLGPRVLRAETAVIAALALCCY